MIITSLNVKGLTNPKKVKKVQAWRRNQGSIDVLVLTEIKVTGIELEKRLKEIDDKFLWIYSTHAQGAGGVAMGLHPKWGPSVKDYNLDMDDKWVAV